MALPTIELQEHAWKSLLLNGHEHTWVNADAHISRKVELWHWTVLLPPLERDIH